MKLSACGQYLFDLTVALPAPAGFAVYPNEWVFRPAAEPKQDESSMPVIHRSMVASEPKVGLALVLEQIQFARNTGRRSLNLGVGSMTNSEASELHAWTCDPPDGVIVTHKSFETESHQPRICAHLEIHLTPVQEPEPDPRSNHENLSRECALCGVADSNVWLITFRSCRYESRGPPGISAFCRRSLSGARGWAHQSCFDKSTRLERVLAGMEADPYDDEQFEPYPVSRLMGATMSGGGIKTTKEEMCHVQEMWGEEFES